MRRKKGEESIVGKVLPFKRPGEPCTEMVHQFDSIPGRCRCGAHLWEEVPKATPPGVLGVFPAEAGPKENRGGVNLRQGHDDSGEGSTPG